MILLRRLLRLATLVAVIIGLLVVTGQPGAAQLTGSLDQPMPVTSTSWVWPLDPLPTVVRVFDPPTSPWDAGHRGADLLGSLAQPVLSIAAGTVTFAGPLAGRGVVVVDHGALRSTYEPVTASVQVGDEVGAGAVIGLLQSTRSHCAPQLCLHLGLRRGEVYLDPLSVLGPQAVRLKPLVSAPTSPAEDPTSAPLEQVTQPAAPLRPRTPPAGAGPTPPAAAAAAGTTGRLSEFTAGIVSAVTGLIVALHELVGSRA